VYFGEYERTVDYKGRMTLPGHLFAPGEEVDWNRVMIVKGDSSCLYLYDLKTWDVVMSAARQSMDDDESRLFMRRRLSGAQVSDVDNLKRITIPGPLLAYARIDKKSIVIGMFNRLELWDPGVWTEYVDSLEDVEIPSIADLSRASIREVS
jgi:MraZ protein